MRVINAVFMGLLFSLLGGCSRLSSAENYKVVTSTTLNKNHVGLRVYKPEKCSPGFTLYNLMTIPDKGFEAGPVLDGGAHAGFHYRPFHPRLYKPSQQRLNPIFLIDMNGSVVHQWFVETSISYGRLTPDGHLVYMTNNFPNRDQFDCSGNSGIRELDQESKVLRYIPSYSQHDFRILDNGTLIVEQYKQIWDKRFVGSSHVIQEMEIINFDGKSKWSWNPMDHAKEIENLTGVDIAVRKEEDWTTNWSHNNTVAIIGDNISAKVDKRFRKGNILFSMPHINVIGVIEYPSGKVVWAWGPGVLDAQHQPSMLENGNILLMDNGKNRGWSRVLEVNPIEKKIVWEYHAEPKESFFSPIISGVTQLPNGNRLICEGTANRIFEITQEGEIVWDYIDNLDRRISKGIMRAHRYTPEYVKPIVSK